MAVVLIVQNDEGDIENANSYIDLAYAKDYWDNQGYNYSMKTDDEISIGLIKGTSFIDYDKGAIKKALGYKKNGKSQTTAFPRLNLFDCCGYLVNTIPDLIKKACAEYAFKALSNDLQIDQTEPTGNIKKIKKKAGSVSKDITYNGNGGQGGALKWAKGDAILNSTCFFTDNTFIGRN